MKNLFIILIISLLSKDIFAQIGINNDGSPPAPSAMLDVKSTTKGFLVPHMTQAQRLAIVNPANGLQVFQTDTNNPGIYYYDGNVKWWTYTGAYSQSIIFNTLGANIYTSFAGNVGIGTATPVYKLTVKTSSPNFGMAHTDGVVTLGTYENGASGQFGTFSNHDLTFFANNNSSQLALLQNGKVGINKATPLADLHIKQSAETYPVNNAGLRLERVSNTNHWDIGTDQGNDLNFTYNGIAKGYIRDVDGVYVPTSDERLKKDIQSIGEVLPSVMQFEAKTYHYKANPEDAPLSYGFIAQEVEKLFPDFVSSKGPDGMKALAYQNIGVVAIKAIQEQQVMIDALLKRIETLKNKK